MGRLWLIQLSLIDWRNTATPPPPPSPCCLLSVGPWPSDGPQPQPVAVATAAVVLAAVRRAGLSWSVIGAVGPTTHSAAPFCIETTTLDKRRHRRRSEAGSNFGPKCGINLSGFGVSCMSYILESHLRLPDDLRAQQDCISFKQGLKTWFVLYVVYKAHYRLVWQLRYINLRILYHTINPFPPATKLRRFCYRRISRISRLGYVGKSPHASNFVEFRIINDDENNDGNAYHISTRDVVCVLTWTKLTE